MLVLRRRHQAAHRRRLVGSERHAEGGQQRRLTCALDRAGYRVKGKPFRGTSRLVLRQLAMAWPSVVALVKRTDLEAQVKAWTDADVAVLDFTAHEYPENAMVLPGPWSPLRTDPAHARGLQAPVEARAGVSP